MAANRLRTDPSGNCVECGQPHPRCHAHRAKVRPLIPCMQYPIRGGFVCKNHGGGIGTVRAAANRRLAEQEANARAYKEVRRLGPRMVEPGAALIEQIHFQAGLVDYWQAQLERLGDEDLVWARAEETEQETRFGTFVRERNAAGEHTVHRLLRQARKDLVDFCAAALRAGVEERQVRIAEQQGALFASVQRAILGRMLDSVLLTLTEIGHGDDTVIRRVARSWDDAVGVVVPEEVRALASRVDR